MHAALALGERGQGTTWPNPAVGCVLVREGRVVGRGWTRPGGRPHAETIALECAGEAARGSTAYVTLEPCANWGRTPPCAGALIEAGVARVVIACFDPDPRVDGKGIAWLREAGLEVAVGTLADRAMAAHLGLYRRILEGRPMVTLKLAQSTDGRLAAAGGHSQWITGEPARREAHRLRATHDAIMVGSGTALIDDPSLTCRIAGLEHRSPVRVVLDRRLRLPHTGELARTARDVPVWVICDAAEESRADTLRAAGAEVLGLASPTPEEALSVLARRGITRLLVEGGSTLAAALLRADLIDRLHVATAPMLIGGDGLPSVAALGVTRVDRTARWRRVDMRRLGSDRLEVLERVREN
ncbi:MAG: bifunctional diaminohydroxyphosphoribosylaminopyrimidine deaminase/5-amino-6-(5-phosphoribosylamino)uracil reductase RibD [Geminicoccaceae bacterium]|nr:bifunctional diaminohydroxyphosphoribosylaminopyrimidine deaminase/5-amino-6-(5-phosphoribosylamino)uracil reductase RibD [Geminicoccaceae bacterium]